VEKLFKVMDQILFFQLTLYPDGSGAVTFATPTVGDRTSVVAGYGLTGVEHQVM
jgi:hypothetical protein